MGTKRLWTIGYERASQAEIIATLRDAGVRMLIDVRDRPLSRRAGFSKRQLQAAVEDAGMTYVHMKALGTPPEGREANHRHDWERFWAIVEERLATPEAELDLARAAALAESDATCLLCYEADWHICHRRRVAEILVARHGFDVQHLAIHHAAD